MKALWLLLVAASVFASEPPVNPDVTQANIQETICVSGWTKTVRPPVSFTNKVKRVKMLAQGLPLSRVDEFELDHTEPLTLGGAPRDVNNLRLQLWPEARVKDKLEVRLNRLVCSGMLPLADAQACIWNDWKACLQLHQAEVL